MTPINCLDCVHVVPNAINCSTGLPAKICVAPQLLDLLDPALESDGELCQCARSFRHACGDAARWFVKREGMRYSYYCDCWKNNGQGCMDHDPQMRLPEQSSGEPQA